MSTPRSKPKPIALTLDTSGMIPFHRQIYEGLRQLILTGRLTAGESLPSTRRLAADLDVARTTVVYAYEQLIAEGYVEGKIGAGTYVADIRPDDHLYAPRPTSARSDESEAPLLLSKRGEDFRRAAALWTPFGYGLRAFPVGVPALDAFPIAEWQRLANQCYRELPLSALGYANPAGYEPLRQAIATYLRQARAVHCDASQVIIVTGAQQALHLAARLLLDPGDTVWVENPGYLKAWEAFRSVGARLMPMPVDSEGIDVRSGLSTAPTARVAYVTPSHQFPLGVTMSLARRYALLQWAQQNQAYIIEDDYDSELRYVGRPLPSLQGLYLTTQVIYVGTFSKVLFPNLRLGYIVVPPALVGAFTAAQSTLNGPVTAIDQRVLARFMADGHFERHIRRMRALYAERQAMLLDHADLLNGLLELSPVEAGMHLVGRLVKNVDDRLAARHAAKLGIVALSLSQFSFNHNGQQGLLLGYTAIDPATIREDVGRLATALRSAMG